MSIFPPSRRRPRGAAPVPARVLSLLVAVCGVLVASRLPAAEAGSEAAGLSVRQIVERHVAARGGLKAWREVRTISWSGRMDAGVGDSAARSARYAANATRPASERQGATARADEADRPPPQVQLPFVLEMKRPHRSRLEIEFAGKTAVQVYDGAMGWKLRPFLNRNDVEPFTEEELKAEDGRGDIDGPLIDYAAKGSRVELVAVEPVEGRDAYELRVTTRAGVVQHVWIDAESFLDVKLEGAPRRMDGRMRDVWILQRDFRKVQGLVIPFLLETAVDGYRDTHRMVIEKVAVNPPLDDARFTRPVPRD